MRDYPIQFPTSWNCRISGVISESADPNDLSEDMLEVALPSGVLVCAGWTDEGSGGGYLISVIRGLEDVIQPIVDRNAASAVETVQQLVDRYRKRAGSPSLEPISNTNTTEVNSGFELRRLTYAY